MAPPLRFIARQEEEICRRYKAGESSLQLAMAFSCSDWTIRSCLSRNGVDRRSKTAHSRKYTCNFCFFQSVDTQTKAYWLGFLLADGCVFGRRLQLTLKLDDIDHLKKFLSDFDATYPVRMYPERNIAEVVIVHAQLIKDLAKYGVIPRKTYNMKWPSVQPNLLRHMIRGYVDGDGGFYHVDNGFAGGDDRFSATGHIDFIEKMQQTLICECNLSKTKYVYLPNTTFVRVSYSGRLQLQRIFTYLYQDATVYMDRKRNLIEPWLFP